VTPPPPQGYQPHTTHGAKVRADVVDVYIFRRLPSARPGAAVEFLQLLRAADPLKDTWHPVMGHTLAAETSLGCALRELEEEVGLRHTDSALLGLWALEQVHPFYIAAIDTVVLSPRFAAEVSPGWEPTLNAEHTAHRWVSQIAIDTAFMWPGQRACCREVLSEIVSAESQSRDRLRVKLESPQFSALPNLSD